MEMALKQVQWGLEQMQLCFHVVAERIERGLFSVIVYYITISFM